MKKVTKAIAASPPDTFTLPCFGQPEFKQQCIVLQTQCFCPSYIKSRFVALMPVNLLGCHLRSSALIGAAGCKLAFSLR